MEPDMRIVFFSYGTRGDAQPQVALAAGLVARGIEARVAAPENLRSFVARRRRVRAALWELPDHP
jgi:UDP:flavonoid glycosyltransferase YjiC (YdhE family)